MTLSAVVAISALLAVDNTDSAYDSAMTRQLEEMTRDELCIASALNVAASLLSTSHPDYVCLDEPWTGDLPPITLNSRTVYLRISDEAGKLAAGPMSAGSEPLELRLTPVRAVYLSCPLQLRDDVLRAFLMPRDELPAIGPLPGNGGSGSSLSDYHTLWSGGTVNVNTASLFALTKLLGSADVAARMIRARKAQPFRNEKELVAFMAENGISPTVRASRALAVTSHVFSVRVTVDGPRRVTAYAVLAKSEDRVSCIFREQFVDWPQTGAGEGVRP